MADDSPDLLFYFDPVCPFAWLTSRWVEMVAEEKEYRVDWRFISLRLLNKDKDYDKEFPPEYEAGHNAGLRLLRVCAAVRDAEGPAAIGPLYTAISTTIFDVDRLSNDPESRVSWGTPDHIGPILESLELDSSFVDALDDPRWDEVVAAETEEALDRAGRDVGTPILAFQPPDGPGFFGPVISRLPARDEAVALWDSVIHLTTYPGFAELKRSLRERPQLRSFGVAPDGVGIVEDWHGGSRRLNSEKG
jgi:hypothetical protein